MTALTAVASGSIEMLNDPPVMDFLRSQLEERAKQVADEAGKEFPSGEVTESISFYKIGTSTNPDTGREEVWEVPCSREDADHFFIRRTYHDPEDEKTAEE